MLNSMEREVNFLEQSSDTMLEILRAHHGVVILKGLTKKQTNHNQTWTRMNSGDQNDIEMKLIWIDIDIMYKWSFLKYARDDEVINYP